MAQYLISATLSPSVETMKRKYIFRYLEVVVFIANEDLWNKNPAELKFYPCHKNV